MPKKPILKRPTTKLRIADIAENFVVNAKDSQNSSIA